MRIPMLVLATLLLGSATRAQEPETCQKCGHEQYGTTVQWAGDPSEAAAQAKKEEKLVFILHVSGHFEDPKFT